MKLPARPEAIAELEESVAYYERRQPGLGLAFLREVEASVAFAAKHPAGGERRGGSDDSDLRRFVVRRFPYVVYVGRVRGDRQVVAVAHTSRRPDYWADRVE